MTPRTATPTRSVRTSSTTTQSGTTDYPADLGCISASDDSESTNPHLGETTIDSGPSGTTSSSDATFEFSSSEPDATFFECRLDQGSFASCSSPKGYLNLPDGTHTFTVRSNAAGSDAAIDVDD